MHRFVYKAVKLIKKPIQTRALNFKPVVNFAQQPGELTRFSDSFLSGTSSEYIDSLFDKWNENPNSVPAEWNAYFR